MQQEKWHLHLVHQQHGIQITPAFRTRPTFGSDVGATTIMVRTRGLSTSAPTLVMRTISTRSAFRLSQRPLKPIVHSFALDKSLIQI